MNADACAEYLVGRGWSQCAADGIAAWLDLDGDRLNIGCWPPERHGQMRDWCGMHERNVTYVTSQLAYLDYALRNTHAQIGLDLDAATTSEAAMAAARPYFNRSTALAGV